MKYSKARIEECVKWVEEHGLYPERFGASQKEFLAAMDIDRTTYDRWSKKPEFHEAIAQAQETFRQKKISDSTSALWKRALGYEITVTKEEAESDKNGKLVTKKASRKIKHFVPDVDALKFILKNMDPEHWKDKQDTDIDLTLDDPTPPTIIFQDRRDETAGLDQEGETPTS